jgi:hypothetical protein
MIKNPGPTPGLQSYISENGRARLLIFDLPNPDKPEITNCKHQITISKSQIRSKPIVWNFEFWSL